MTVNREDEDETELVLHYTYSPGYPERGPTYDCGGTPVEPPELEIYLVSSEDEDDIELTEEEIEKFTLHVMENHVDDGFDADAAYEAKRDQLIEDKLNDR